MSAAEVMCPNCRLVLADALFNQPSFVPCPACAKPLQVLAFPALYRPATAARTGERLLTDADASCFYHPQKKAEVPCDQCGRFLCALCDVPLGERHLCPACIEAGRTKGTMASLQNRRTAYDTGALMLGVMPPVLATVFFFLAPLIGPCFVLTGPAAIVVGIRGWKRPGSLVRTSRWRLVAGALGGVLQIGVLLFFGVAIFQSLNN